jgi:hypothetical protein
LLSSLESHQYVEQLALLLSWPCNDPVDDDYIGLVAVPQPRPMEMRAGYGRMTAPTWVEQKLIEMTACLVLVKKSCK